MADETPTKKAPSWTVVWREARDLVWARRGRLAVGMILMAISRLAGLVLPASSKILIDEVVGKSRADLLWPLAAAAGAATVVQAATGFALSQVLGIAGLSWATTRRADRIAACMASTEVPREQKPCASGGNARAQ